MSKAGDRLSGEQLQASFADVPPRLTDDEARLEAAHCVYCFDAPCARACPTHIDIPKFIRQIMHRDDLGAARTILEANIFGGSCARACPTEVLCEGACVDNALVKAPVQIGRLQRFACDAATEKGVRFFEPGAATGKHVAVVGSGPAGLTCAHELRKRGHSVVVFEARGVPGGLNTLGIAAYKISTEFALTEVELIKQLGIEIHLNRRVSASELKGLLEEYDAVFLGIGLGATQSLGIEGEDLPGVWEALSFIFQTHTKPFSECEIGKRVLVIGGGNTAADVATASCRLGAEQVTVAYRRGAEAMPAYAYEYEYMKQDGVQFEWFAQPMRIIERHGVAAGVEFVRTKMTDPASRRSKLTPVPGSEFTIEADMIVKALGQDPVREVLDALPELRVEKGKIVVDAETGATSVMKLYAGGDCLSGGAEIVNAVEEGKIAAAAIDEAIGGN